MAGRSRRKLQSRGVENRSGRLYIMVSLEGLVDEREVIGTNIVICDVQLTMREGFGVREVHR